MFFVIVTNKMGSVGGRSPLAAADALQRIEEAEAKGQTATCTDTDGKPVSKDDLRRAAGYA